MIDENYFTYIVKEDTTLTDLMEEKNSIFGNYNSLDGRRQLLNVIGDNDGLTTNLDRIYYKYSETDKDDTSINTLYNNGNLEDILAGTELVIPKDMVPVNLVALRGKNLFLEQGNFDTFISKNLEYFINSSEYIKSTQIDDESNNVITTIKNYNISVWIYIRSQNKIKDITQFVNFVSTSSGVGSGRFSIEVDGIDNIDNVEFFGEDSYYHHKIGDYDKIRTSYFMKYLQQKDVVFIRFEKLDIEHKRKLLIDDIFDVNVNLLPNQFYDMIGFIDDVRENINFNDKVVNISGRDLMGILEDDASYFYPIMFSDTSDYLTLDLQDDSRWFKRNFIKGVYENLFVYDMRGIGDSIGFVINQLSNMGIVPDNLFSGYSENNNTLLSNNNRLGDRRTKAFQIAYSNEKDNGKTYIDWVNANGIWQIVDVLIDDNIKNRKQVNSQLINSSGNLLSQMQNICQDPFVEFFGDTYGDKYVFTARQKPFRGENIINYLNKNTLLEINNEDIISLNIDWEKTYYTWYQIEPTQEILGYKKDTFQAYVPIIYLPSFADNFGNNRFVISDSYISEKSLKGDKNNINVDSYINAIIEDLMYVIESTCYLPFTRCGTITINGDRRFKKNTWIRLNSTGEIYYIDSVDNYARFSRNTIDRVTTLKVSRGMVEKYVKGYYVGSKSSLDVIKDSDFLNELKDVYSAQVIDAIKKGEYPVNIDPVGVTAKKLSYFNIIDTKLIKDSLVYKEEQSGDNVTLVKVKKNVKVKFDVDQFTFNFFLSRSQM